MKLINNDCLIAMAEMPDASVDAVIADPPFGTTCCHWDTVIPFAPMWEQLKRIAKDRAAIVLFGSEPFSSLLRCSNLKMYKYDWVWEKSRKTGHLFAKKQPMTNHENIVVFYVEQPTYNPQGLSVCSVEKINTEGRKKSNVYGQVPSKDIHIQTSTGYPTKIIKINSEHNVNAHPTQKPVALLEYLIRTYTNEGDTVLDFCFGSGTTAIACINTNRNFIGIEKDETYFKVAQNRINEATRQLKLF